MAACPLVGMSSPLLEAASLSRVRVRTGLVTSPIAEFAPGGSAASTTGASATDAGLGCACADRSLASGKRCRYSIGTR